MHLARSSSGFTLPEIVIAIAVLAILSGVSAQYYGTWVEQSKRRVLVEHYHSLFAFARWSAASQNQIVTVCPLSPKNACVDDWQNTISVFTDFDNDKQPDKGTVIRQFPSQLGKFTVYSRTAGRGYFQFNSEGMAHGAMGSLVLCPPSPVSGNMSYMAINIAGRFRVERDKDADGQITLPWGTKIHCSG